MAHKVFICHSSKDKAVADAACAALEAHRIPCWIAPRDILAGDEYAASIIDALDDTQIVLLIFSAHANDSTQVRREIERAVSKEKIIVPFRIENVMPSRAMEFYLMTPHWLDALTPPIEQRLTELCNTISRILERRTSAAPSLWKPPNTNAADDAENQARRREDERLNKERLGQDLSSRRAGESDRSLRPKAGDRNAAPRTGTPRLEGAATGMNRKWQLLVGITAILVCLATAAILIVRQHRASVSTQNNAPPAQSKSLLLRTLNAEDVISVAFSPDGRTLAGRTSSHTGGEDNTVKIWDVASGQPLQTLQDRTDDFFSLAFTFGGRPLAASSGDKTIKLWDVNTGEILRTLEDGGGDVSSGAFSPDNRILASGNHDGTIKLWDLHTGQIQGTLPGTKTVLCLAFSPDGRTLASGNGDASIKLWDVDTRQLIRTMQEYSTWNLRVYTHADYLRLAFSPDGRTLASDGDGDDPVWLWNVDTGRPVRTFKGHIAYIQSIAFSPDGRTLASSGGGDPEFCNVILWDINTGQILRTLYGHTSAVFSIAFSPDGHTLASSSDDKTIKLWDVSNLHK